MTPRKTPRLDLTAADNMAAELEMELFSLRAHRETRELLEKVREVRADIVKIQHLQQSW